MCYSMFTEMRYCGMNVQPKREAESTTRDINMGFEFGDHRQEPERRTQHGRRNAN